MSLKELLTDYWSQTTFILLGFGIIIKIILDFISKKKEINHSLFQDKKLQAVNKFFRNFSKIEQYWIELPIYEIIRKEIQPKELDDIQFPLLSNLKQSILELQIYFKETEHKKFRVILENTFEVKRTLSDVYLNYSPGEKSIERSNKFIFKRDQISERNQEIINEITKSIRTTFN